MPFKVNNPGKPKGATNKTTKLLRERVNEYLLKNFEKLEAELEQLPPKEKVRAYCELLQYGLPKLQAVSTSNAQLEEADEEPRDLYDLTKLSDDELKQLDALLCKSSISTATPD